MDFKRKAKTKNIMSTQISKPKSLKPNFFSKFKLTRKLVVGLFIVIGVFAIIAGISLTLQKNDKTALAASCTWTGNNSGDFSDSGNWSGCGGVPQNFDDVLFPDVASNYTLNNDLSGVSLNSVTIESLNTQDYVLSGNTLLTTGITGVAGNYNFIYNTDVNTCKTEGDINMTINSGKTYTSGCDGVDYTFSSTIVEGSGTFVKAGNGNLTFSTTQVFDANFTVVDGLAGTDYGSEVTFNNSVDLVGGILFALGPINVPNNTIQVNSASGIYQYSGLITAYGISFNGGGNSSYLTWAGNGQNTTITGSNVDLNGVTFDSNYFDTLNQEQIVIQTTNGFTISGEFSNLPAAGSLFINVNNTIVELKAFYNSDNVVVKVVSVTNGTNIVVADANSINCTPNTGYGSVTPTCSASFTSGKQGTITFNTSAGSCTTPTIVPTDTQASCNFTISTPSFTPYQVDVSASGGGNLNGVDYVYVYQTPAITSVNPASGPVVGGTSVTVDLSTLSGNDRNYKVVRDSSDNIYVVGQVSGTVKVGSSYVNGFGGTDIFIAKYDSSGNILWAKTAGGSGDDTAYSVVIDSNSDIYVTGNFQGYANIVGFNVVSAGSGDVFIAKLDSNGNTIWVRTGGGTQNDSAQGMDIDSSGNIYIVGYFSSVSAFGGTNLTSAGLTDVFILKLDSNGNWVWAKRGGGSSYEYVGGIAVNPTDGSVYVSGHYNNITSFGSTTLVLDLNRSGYDGFLAKTDSNGDWVWAKDVGNTGVDTYPGDQGFSNKVYADNDGNAYILGGFYKDYIDFGSAGQVTNVSTNGLDPFNSAPAQHYIAKADIDGNWLWAKPLGESTYYFSGAFKIKDTSTAYVSTLIIRSNSLSFGGTTINKTTTGGNANAIVAKVNLVDGSFSDVVQTTGTSGSEVIRDIEIDSSNNLVLVGNTSGASNFGSNSYSSIGGQDLEISKLDTTSNTFTSLQGLGSTIPFFVDLNPSANSILFDGTAGNITSVNTPLQAVVDSPAHAAGLVDVIARNSLSTSVTLNGTFDYIGSSLPPIQNSNISSVICTPSSPTTGSNVNCTISTNVNLNTLSGSINLKIGNTGSVVNCPVTGSGTTLACNNVGVGGTPGTLRSQYNASGSGSTYADGNNITVTSNSGSGGTCSGSGNGSGTPGQTTVDLCVDGSTLILYAGDSNKNNDICTTADITAGTVVDTTISGQSATSVTCTAAENSIALSPVTVDTKRQFTTAVIDDIIFEDLRGLATSNYTVTATISNFVDPLNTNKKIDLGSNPDSDNNETDQDKPTQTDDRNKIFGVLDPSIATITPLRSAATIAFGTDNYIKGSRTTLTDNVTQVTLLSTSAPTKPGRIALDNILFKLRIPSLVSAGNFKGTIVETVI